MTQKFVILGWQRTGSNMLVSALNAHPHIRCHGELLRRNVKDLAGALRVVRQMDEKFHAQDHRHSLPMQYLKEVSYLDETAPFWGFKLLCGQNESTWHRLAQDPDWKPVILYRDNLLAMYSSHLTAIQSRKASIAGASAVQVKQVEFKQKQFARFMDERLAQYADLKERLAKAGVSYIETRYLDITADEGVQRIVEFIGAPNAGPLTPRTAKRNTSLILDRFTNPKKAESYLREIGRQDWSTEGRGDDS